MFAKGFVTTPKLSWDDNTTQLIAAWVVGAIGVLGLGWLLFQAVQVLRPTVPELGNLPATYKEMVDKTPELYLPQGCDSVDTFRTRLSALRANANQSAAGLKQAQDALTAAKAATPQVPVDIHEAEAKVAAASRTHESIAAGLLVFEGVRKDLLDRAGYWSASNELSFSTPAMVFAACLAAVGGIGYQLLLANPDADDEPATATPPSMGELIQTDTDAGRQLWGQLGLAACQADPQTARIAVIVTAGEGTVADPYTVSTLPAPTCPAQTFTVIDEVAQVTVPAKTTITYTPAPSLTKSPSISPNSN
jgi:hypothetical protein